MRDKSAVMYGCKSWIIKKTEHQRIDAFDLYCWRRLLRDPWTARRSNQSILKKINPEYSLEDWCWSWSSNPLATWFEELTHWKRPWCWETLKAEGEGDNRAWADWMASLTQQTWVWVNSGRWWRTGKSGELQSRGSKRIRHDLATEQEINQVSTKWTCGKIMRRVFKLKSAEEIRIRSVGELK